MFKHLYNELSLTLHIVPDGPILIKAGETGADPTRPDMEFVRTVYLGKETIYLPGSSLKGVLRAHCERLARTVQVEKYSKELGKFRLSCDPLEKALSCGDQWNNEKRDAKEKKREAIKNEEIYKRSCFVCRLFGSTSLASRTRITDAYPKNPEAVKSEERNGVAIDRVFGSVAVGPFNYEVATAGEFICHLQLRNFTIAQLGLLALALRDLEMQRVGIGFAKSRGLGRVNSSIHELTVRYPTCSLNGKLRLFGGTLPDTEPNQLPGVGRFPCSEDYGLDKEDLASLPGGITLAADDWGEPFLRLDDAAKVKELFRECVRSWKSTVEALQKS